MSEFFFVIKTLVFSVLILVGLQLRIGGVSVEERSKQWIYQSNLGGEIQAVARGATKAGQEGWSWARHKISEVNSEKSSKAAPSTKASSKDSSAKNSWEEDLD